MDELNAQGQQASLPSIDGVHGQTDAHAAAPAAPATVPAPSIEVADPKQQLAQFSAAAEVILLRTQNAPRARAEQLSALKQQYIKARFGVTIQAPSK